MSITIYPTLENLLYKYKRSCPLSSKPPTLEPFLHINLPTSRIKLPHNNYASKNPKSQWLNIATKTKRRSKYNPIDHILQ